MFQSLVTPGRLVSINDEVALIRYAPQHDTFVKMLERNGKKEIVREKLSEAYGQSIGVKFEVDPNAEPGPTTPPPGAAIPTPAARPAAPRPASPSRPQPPPEEPQQPATSAIKLTPELVESLRQEPLVKALMDQMGATIVKVE